MARKVKKVPMSKQGSAKDAHKEAKSDSTKGSEKKVQDHTEHKHRESHRTHHKQRSRRRQGPGFSRVVLFLLLLLAVGFFLFEEFEFGSEDKGPVAATVDGVDIYVSEVEEHFDTIPQEMRAGMTKDVILDQIISQEVLLQEAERLGVTVSDEEIDEELEFAMAQAGWSEDEFDQVLAAQGMTKEDLREMYRVSIVIDDLINQEVLDQIEVTDEEVEQFFEQNKGRYVATQDEVRASHILISTEQREDDEAREIAEGLLGRARDGEDFAELAAEYSEDPSVAENEGDLGFFGRGMMVPEFEEVIFDMENVGDISDIITTDFGYHIAKLYDRRYEGDEPEFADIRDRVEQDLLNEARSMAVESYIIELRESKDIEKHEVEEIDLPEAPEQPPGQGQEIEITEEDLEAMQEGDDGMEVEIQ